MSRHTMRCTPGMVEFKDDGREVYFKKCDCPLVRHWATKHKAEVKVAWIPEGGGDPLLFCLNKEPIGSLVPAPQLQKGDTVWAVPSSEMEACQEASLIRRLVSTQSAGDREGIRRQLSEAGYPEDVLDAARLPNE